VVPASFAPQSPADAKIQFRPTYTELAVEKSVQLIIKVLTRMNEYMAIAMPSLPGVEESEKPMHSNDVWPNPQKSD